MKSTSLLHFGLLAPFVAFLGAASAGATVIFSDSFSSSDGTLLSATSGWTRQTINFTATTPIAINNSAVTFGGASVGTEVDYASFGSDSLVSAGAGSVYTGFDFTITSIGTSNVFPASFLFNPSSNFTEGFLVIQPDGSGGYRFGSRLAFTTFGTTSYALGQTYRVVLALTFNAGVAAEVLQVFVNDTLAATQADVRSNGINHFGIRQGSGTYSVTFDNLVLATTYAEAATFPAAIPEPSTYAAFAGVLGLGLAALRRRRNA